MMSSAGGVLPAMAGGEAASKPVPMGIARVCNRVMVEVNEPLCAMLGYAADELIGRSTAVLYESEEEFHRVGGQILSGLEHQGAALCAARFCRKGGAVIEVLLTTTHATVEGESIFVVLDVTQSRRAEQELFWQNRELTAFHRISEVMLSDRSTQFIFDTIARETSGMTDFPMVAIELCDFERMVMVYRGAHGIPLHEMPSPFEVPMDVSLSGQVAHSGEPLVEHNIADRREYAAPILRLLGVRTFVCVPIKTEGRVVGTLSLSHREHLPVEPRVVKAVSSLANYLATLFDRLQAREAVSRSEAELSSVYDRVPSMLCLFDEQLQIVRANLAATEFADCIMSKDVPPKRFGEFFHCQSVARHAGQCGKQDRCLDCELRRVLVDTLTTGKSQRQIKMTSSLVRSGQTETVVLLVSTERIQLGSTVRVLMCLEDITKNVRADEQIRSQAALLDITGDAILVRDFTDRIIYWNEGAHRMYGWTPAEAIGRTTTELMPDQSLESARALQAVQQRDEWAGEIRQRSRDGRDLTIHSRWTLVREPDGKPKAILIVNSDVTEKKRLESQLLRSQRLESIGTLASGLAHDLNNVLAPIMMAVQYIKDNSEDDGIKACFQTLETCSRRGADIIRQVLMFARGVEGQRILLNPKHLIMEMQRIANETFPRSIEINAQMSKQPCILLGDATQIQQVIMNLCVNARDAMPRGGVLTIGLEKRELDAARAGIHPKAKPGAYVVISVTDTGTGIPPDLVDKIFDPFFTTKPLGQGTGLGLPTVMGIAENHGGFVHLETSVGKGTTFCVYIPAAPGDALGSEDANDQAEPPKGKGELILVVDDEPSVRKLASAILGRHGYRTVTAAEGQEGLKMYELHRQNVRLVISDLMMPQLDGPGMLRGLRDLEPKLKSIIITGLGEENRITEAKAAGADLILNKPFTADQLLVGVKQLIG